MQFSVFSSAPNGFQPTAYPRNAAVSRSISVTVDSSDSGAQRLQRMAEKGGKVAEIVDRYNLRNISYTDLQTMTKELMAAGALKESEMLDFLPPSTEYSSLDGSRNVNWNAPKDYIGLVEQQINAQENGFATDASTLKYLKYQLELMQRFERPAFGNSGHWSSTASENSRSSV